MDRRHFIRWSGAGMLALTLPLPSAAASRSNHAEAMVAAKARIRHIGQAYKSSGWSDPGLKGRLAAEARVYASHHRALARIEGRA